MNFYVANSTNPVVTTVKTLDDIGPEFNFTVKVHLANPPYTVSLSHLLIFNQFL